MTLFLWAGTSTVPPLFSPSVCACVPVHVRTVTCDRVSRRILSSCLTPRWGPSDSQSRANVLGPGVVGLFTQGIETGMIFSQLVTWLSLPRHIDHCRITVHDRMETDRSSADHDHAINTALARTRMSSSSHYLHQDA